LRVGHHEPRPGVGRDEALAELHAAADQEARAVARHAQVPAGDLDREGGIVVAAIDDGRVLEARGSVRLEREVAVAEGRRCLADRLDRRQEAGRRRWVARAAGAGADDPVGVGGEIRRGRRVLRRCAELEGERHDDIPGVCERGRQDLIARRALEQAAGRLCELVGAACAIAGSVPTKRLRERIEKRCRHCRRLGLGKKQVDADRGCPAGLDARDQIGDHGATPRPASDLADAGIVDQHEDDRIGGLAFRREPEAKIQQVAFEIAHEAGLARRQIGEKHETCRQERGARLGQPGEPLHGGPVSGRERWSW
jgi:hypothetical protein